MRFKANSDSPGNKSLLSGEGQRARPEKEISANNADLEREKNKSSNDNNIEGQRARSEKEISANNVKDNVIIIIKILLYKFAIW